MKKSPFRTFRVLFAAALMASAAMPLAGLAAPFDAQSLSGQRLSGQAQLLSGEAAVINRQVAELQRVADDDSDSDASGSGGTAGTADLQARMDAIEENMRTLNGRVDEVQHQVDQTNTRLDKLQADIDLRFQDLQGGAAAGGTGAAAGAAAAAPSSADSGNLAPQDTGGTNGGGVEGNGVLGTMPASTPPAADATGGALPSGTPKEQYDAAIALMKRGQYPEARNAFDQFLAQHADDPLAGNAQYWLGETYYVQGDYKSAADAFLKGYTTYSKSTKAPDSLLKLGMTLGVLKQTKAACATFGELGKRFPKASQAIVQRAKVERQKAGC
ncbi:MAG: tol-pal system protein YbgF [Parvibaculaceae bacterium]|nr:tol-pal system protein YbgF [Parvibaculaceae bacterium]